MSDDFPVVLAALADEERPVHSIDLGTLSDPPRAQLAQIRMAWAGYSPERRRAVVAAMVDQAEKNIRLNFHAILRTFLTDGDPDVRRLAIEGLWEDERPNLVQPLSLILSNDVATEVRAAAAISLGRFVLLGEL